MLSYRHAFHAGNHADVLKHVTLLAALRHLHRKPKPITVIDTHAGPGIFPLDAEWTARHAEFETGVGKLWGNAGADPLLDDWLSVLAEYNASNGASTDELLVYPGSPAICRQVQRESDRMLLFELHPADFTALSEGVGAGPRVVTRCEDGFRGAIAASPPTPRRGLVLIDPPYEVGTDYRRVVDTLVAIHRRWATAVIIAWYPRLARARDRSRILVDGLRDASLPATLQVEFAVGAQAAEVGMHGSGLLIVNTPWQLDTALAGTLAVMADSLATNDAPRPVLRWLKAPD